jgi:hypothetical protein
MTTQTVNSAGIHKYVIVKRVRRLKRLRRPLARRSLVAAATACCVLVLGVLALWLMVFGGLLHAPVVNP